MSAHPTSAFKAPPLVISLPSLLSTERPERDTEPASSPGTSMTSPLEPHWEPVASAATD